MGRSPLSQFADACISDAGTTSSWFARVAAAAAPIYERGGGAGAGIVLFPPGGGRDNRRTGAVGPAIPFCDADWSELMAGGDVRPAMQPFSVSLLSAAFHKSTMRGDPLWEHAMAVTGADGWADCVGCGVVGPFGLAVLCSMVPDRGWDTSRWRDVRLMRRHLASVLDARLSCDGPEDAGAVLSPDGRLEHARGDACAARDLLVSAVQNLDAARRGADSHAEGDAVWRELLEGGWSAIEHIESDGKRHILFARAASHPALALSPRESALLELVDRGLSNKQIAMELGLSDAAVSGKLHEALRKLRFRSRVEYLRYRRNAGR